MSLCGTFRLQAYAIENIALQNGIRHRRFNYAFGTATFCGQLWMIICHQKPPMNIKLLIYEKMQLNGLAEWLFYLKYVSFKLIIKKRALPNSTFEIFH